MNKAKVRVNVNMHDVWRIANISPPKILRSMVGATIEHLELNCPNTIRISALLCDDINMRTLNSRYRKKNIPTNVLSFPYAHITPATKELPVVHCIGELAFSFETIAREADELHKPICCHFAQLAVHGTLHLLGYDHELSEKDADVMENLEMAILAGRNIDYPYGDSNNIDYSS